jgi:hypothetical protein
MCFGIDTVKEKEYGERERADDQPAPPQDSAYDLSKTKLKCLDLFKLGQIN